MEVAESPMMSILTHSLCARNLFECCNLPFISGLGSSIDIILLTKINFFNIDNVDSTILEGSIYDLLLIDLNKHNS